MSVTQGGLGILADVIGVCHGWVGALFLIITIMIATHCLCTKVLKYILICYWSSVSSNAYFLSYVSLSMFMISFIHVRYY